MRYLALLRGINVGGKNIVKMPDLRACFDRLGLDNVTTYIQSGNVLFDCKLKNATKVSVAIEEALASEFSCASAVVVVPEAQLEKVVMQAPPSFGTDPAAYRYDVVFLRPPFRARDVLPTISLKTGVRRGLRSQRCSLLPETHGKGNSKSLSEDPQQCCLQKHDDPQLEHDN